MRKLFVLLFVGTFVLAGAGCQKEAAAPAGGAKDTVKEVEQGLEKEVGEAAGNIAASEQLTLKQALPVAEAKAKEWAAGAQVTQVISGPDIKEDGRSGYWEFKFRVPGDKESLFAVETQGGKIINTEDKRSKWYNQMPLPENMLDSDKLYQRSSEEFKKLHPSDFGDYKISFLGFQCSDTGTSAKSLPKPSCFLTYYQEKHTAEGAAVDPASGEFVAEVK